MNMKTVLIAIAAFVVILAGCDTTSPSIPCDSPGGVMISDPGEEIVVRGDVFHKIWSDKFVKCPGATRVILSGLVKSAATFYWVKVKGRIGGSVQYGGESAGDWDGFRFEWDISSLSPGASYTVSLWAASQAGPSKIKDVTIVIE